MDPRRLLTFRAVARRRSFSQAARDLALSQPSVSQQVGALERELGTPLLERRPGGLRLTRAGTVLLEHADAIAERLELAEVQLAEIAGAERTTLRIGAFPTALASLVPRAMERLEDATVIVEEGGSTQLAERVRSGAVHLAVTFQDAQGPRVEPPGLERRDLLRETFLVTLAPDHPPAGRDAVDLAELAGEGWTAPSSEGVSLRPRVARDRAHDSAERSRPLRVRGAPALRRRVRGAGARRLPPAWIVALSAALLVAAAVLLQVV